MGLRLLSIVLLLLATQAHARDRPLYDAGDSIRRAQVGTYSARLAPSLRVSLGESARFRTSTHRKRQIQQDFERLQCRIDDATNSMTCVEFPAEEVNPYKKTR
jgi:hypothetical protein